jgi:hypothetical protein
MHNLYRYTAGPSKLKFIDLAEKLHSQLAPAPPIEIEYVAGTPHKLPESSSPVSSKAPGFINP